MGEALLIARSRLRRNLTATVLLVVLAGFGGGVVLASVAGLRRAEASWERLQAENPIGDALVVFLGPSGEPASSVEDDLSDEVAALQELDEIASVSRATAAIGVVEAPDGSARFPVAANVYLDDPHPALVGRPVMVAGTMPDPAADDEVAIDELLADRLDVAVGDRVPLTPYRFDEVETASDGRDLDAGGVPTDMRVTGIVRKPEDLLPPRTDQLALYADEPYLLLTPGWWAANGPDVGNYGIFVLADLREGVAFADFEASIAERFGEAAFAVQGVDEVGVPAEVKRAVDRQVGAEGRAVAAFAATVALAAVALLALALGRQLATEGADTSALRALGLTTRSLVQVTLLRSLVIAVCAGAVSVLVAIAASAWLPVGVGRRTLRDRGIDADVSVLLGGFVTIALLVTAVSALIAARAGRGGAHRRRGSTLAERLARIGASPSATVGVHRALDRSASDAGGRAAIGVVGLAVAVTIAASGVVGSLGDLRSHPSRLGQVWDASAGNFASEDGLANGLEVLSEVDGIDAVAGELSITAAIEERTVSAVAFEPFEGALEPHLLSGRAIERDTEVVLGQALADTLEVGVGDRVPMSFAFADDPLAVEVVGIGPVAAMGFDVDPGRAVLVHPDLASRDEDTGVSVLVVRFEKRADRAATLAELRQRFPSTVLEAPVPSRSVQTLSGLTALPLALAVTVGLLALAAAANGAIGSVRRGRRDLAILKVLGLQRSQVRDVVRWQALTWAVLAVVVGVPAGLVMASVGWREVVRSVGLRSPLTVPYLVLAAVVLATPAVLVALSWWPARQAAETPPALTLRSE